jgi:hypothetical protein
MVSIARGGRQVHPACGNGLLQKPRKRRWSRTFRELI